MITAAFRTFILTSAAAIIAATPGGAQDLSNPQSQFTDNLPPQQWIATTEKTERGHRIGKPEAKAQLIEFISYTCGACASFAQEADGALDLTGVGPGYVSVEVRPIIRNYLDLVVSVLVQCGDPKDFKRRHRAFLYSQDVWLKKAINAPQSQQTIWARGDAAGRANAARALDLDDTLLAQGMTAPQINACLADQATALQIVQNSNADGNEFQITGTPSFALNGAPLTGVHDWQGLSAILQQRFRPPAPESVTPGQGG